MKKKKYSLIIAALVLIILSAISIIVIKSTKKEIINISFAYSFEGEKATSLSRQLRHYQSINPGITITEYQREPQKLKSEILEGTLIPDIFINFGPVSQDLPLKVSKTILWTGDLWTLIVNPDFLDTEDLNTLKSHSDIENFSRILKDIYDSGIIPISVGNSHLWPLTIWEQHVEVALSEQFTNPTEPAMDNFSEIRYYAWDLMASWYKKGYFLKDVWDEGWARGLIAIVEGKAAMALMSGKMITSIPAEERDNFLYLPFPHKENNNWIIGSGYSIVMNDDSRHNEEVEKLIAYLTSEGVTQILTKELKIHFFSTKQTTANTFLPSWESLANSEEMRIYGKELQAFVNRKQ